MSRTDLLRARIDRTLHQLAGLSLPAGVRLPTGPGAQLRAALDLVLPHLPAERAEALITTYAEQQLLACVHDLLDDPEILDLVQRPAAELPRLRRGLDRLLQPRSTTWHPWSAPDADALLAERPTPLHLHQLTAHAPGSPMRGLAPFQRAVLRQRLAVGTPPTTLLDRHLNAHLLHELCRGPARGWAGGWPAFTLLEAATTHVQRRCAPEQVFPTTLGEAPGGYRHFAMLGAYLALWRGEARTWQLATASRTPQDGLGDRVSAPLALADLQAWLARGGHHLGPAWSDPFAWLKLLAQATHGGPLDALLRKVPRNGPATVELAQELPDLLTAAANLRWSELPVWREPTPPESLPDLLGAAVSAMLCEDVSGPTLEAAPSDPPRGELLLHTESCTLEAHPRAHRQYTEPARWLLPPGWVASLHRRGLRTLTLRGVDHSQRGAALDRLLDLGESGGPLPAALTLDLRAGDPTYVPPSDLQLRHGRPVLTLGCALAHTWGERLAAGAFTVTPSPFGLTADPISAARALAWSATDEPLPHDVLVRDGAAWRGRWHDPGLRFDDREHGFTTLDQRLHAARAAVHAQALIVLSWSTAWVPGDDPSATPRLLSVDEIVQATREALDAITLQLAHPRVALALHPGGEPGRTATERLHSKATLALAARALAEHPALTAFPSYERCDPRTVAPDGALTPAADEALFHAFLAAWLAPDSRRWLLDLHALLRDRALGLPDDPLRRAALHDHPFLPQPWPATAAEPTPEPEPVAPWDETAWLRRLTELLEPGRYLALHEQLPWARRLHQHLDELPPPPAAQLTRAQVLQHLIDKVDELEQPDALSAAYARLIHAALHDAWWTPDQLAPLLRFGLRRQWLDHLDDLLLPFDELRRERLALALLEGRDPPKKGQVRTPFDRCVGVLLGVG